MKPPEAGASVDVLKRLMVPPESVGRKRASSCLFAPYSPKNHRRHYCYTLPAYDLWVELEWDHAIAEYNEAPSAIEIPASTDASFRIQPAAVSRTKGDLYAIHLIVGDETSSSDGGASTAATQEDPTSGVLTKWAQEAGAIVKTWTAKDLAEPLILHENKKMLLRHVSVEEFLPPLSVQESLKEEIRRHRTVTVDSVLEAMVGCDESVVLSAVALALKEKRCHSDIHRYPFHYSTELSIHHEFSQ